MSDKLTALEIAARVNDQKLTPAAAVSPFLDNIRERNSSLNALVTVLDMDAIEVQCQEVEERIKQYGPLPLSGVAVAIKDNISTKGIRTTCASKMLMNFTPVYNATVVEKLRAAGAVIVAKANLDEFAMGSANENSAFGPAKNPWDIKRVPGGSSGGSAAAVAARMCPIALGSDTGGSIRQPAALCGIVGLKPTYGSVSRYGLIAYASSLDQIGPMTTSIEDAAAVFEVIRGYDPKDATSNSRSSFQLAIPSLSTGRLEGLKIGLIEELCFTGVDEEVQQILAKAENTFLDLGATVKKISIPELQHALAAYYVIASAEASSNLARYDGVRFGSRDHMAQNLKDLYLQSRSKGFGKEVKHRIMLGTYALSSGYFDAYYGKATRARKLISEKIQATLTNFDLLMSPTTPTPAWPIGEKIDDPVKMYVNDMCTTVANLTGSPALSVPAGFTSDNLPIGVQLLGKNFEESVLFTAARKFEEARQDISRRSAYD